MKVSLVSVTTSIKHSSPEDLIVYCARVSSPQNQDNTETGPRLLRYLIKHRHWSPFEMVDMTVEIETSRAIAAQILRHRSFSFQEFSQRYAVADMGFETCEGRRQGEKNRQGSFGDLSEDLKKSFDGLQRTAQEAALQLYKQALGMGVSREQARMLLPLSTRTVLYMKGSVRSWIHYFQARLWDEGVQQEHRDVAAECWGIFKVQFPVTAEAIREGETE